MLSFSALSKLYSNLKNEDKNHIAREHYKLPYAYIKSWLRVLSDIRNICAHYRRLYGRKLDIVPRLDEKDARLGFDNNRVSSLRDYGPCQCKYCVDRSIAHDDRARLHFLERRFAELSELGSLPLTDRKDNLLKRVNNALVLVQDIEKEDIRVRASHLMRWYQAIINV